MGDREAFEARLEALALHLAAAFDLPAVMRIRAAIKELIGQSIEVSSHRDHDRDHRFELRRRARELKQRAELIAGDLLLMMVKTGERRGYGGDMRTAAGRARTSMASLGFPSRTTPGRWQLRAGLAPEQTFNRRVAEATDIEPIKALIAETKREARQARSRADQAAQMLAIAKRTAARRRGGQLLLGGANPAGIGYNSARHWRKLAQMNEGEFSRAVEAAAEAALAHVSTRPELAARIVMTRTEFVVDERTGNMCRQVYAVDGPAATGPPQ
jgi:hypothetical protein